MSHVLRRAILLLSVACTAAAAPARPDPTLTLLTMPRQEVVMGDDIAHAGWSPRLAHPNSTGQFEILVRAAATPFRAPACRSRYLVVRMPASISVAPDAATDAAAARKRRFYDRLQRAYDHGEPLRFAVFAGPYGTRQPDGTVVLSACNLFFVPPPA
jgi:hypothetical protein